MCTIFGVSTRRDTSRVNCTHNAITQELTERSLTCCWVTQIIRKRSHKRYNNSFRINFMWHFGGKFTYTYCSKEPCHVPLTWTPEIRLIHIGDFFKREASDFFLTPMDTCIFYSIIQICNFPAIFWSENKNCLQTSGCCTHSSEWFLSVVVG